MPGGGQICFLSLNSLMVLEESIKFFCSLWLYESREVQLSDLYHEIPDNGHGSMESGLQKYYQVPRTEHMQYSPYPISKSIISLLNVRFPSFSREIL